MYFQTEVNAGAECNFLSCYWVEPLMSCTISYPSSKLCLSQLHFLVKAVLEIHKITIGKYKEKHFFCIYYTNSMTQTWASFYCTNPAILLVPTTEIDQKKSNTIFKRAQSPSDRKSNYFSFLNIKKYRNLLNIWKNDLQKLFSHALPSWFVCLQAPLRSETVFFMRKKQYIDWYLVLC